MNNDKAESQNAFFGEGFFDWQGSSAAVAEKSREWHYDEERYWGGFARDVCREPVYPPLFLGPFKKYTDGPVFAPAAGSWDCGHIGGGVHNGSAVQKDGKIYYIYRGEMPHKLIEVEGGFGGDGTDIVMSGFDYVCDIGVAESSDGIHFRRVAGPLFRTGDEDFSFEDVCCVRKGDMYYLFCNRWNWHAPKDPSQSGVFLATSKDLLHWEARGLVFPHAAEIHRNACVVQNLTNDAVRVNGRYLMYLNNGLVAYSDDLLHWESEKIGIRWPGGEGCLALSGLPGHESDILLFTGGHHTGHFYAVGEVLFAGKDPTHPVQWLNFPVLYCEDSIPWECGRSPLPPHPIVSRWRDTVFFTGMTLFRGKIYLYYAGSEYYTCLATTELPTAEEVRAASALSAGAEEYGM